MIKFSCGFLKLIFLTIFLSGCGEDSVKLDISGFNKMIEFRTDFKSAADVMNEFYKNYYGNIDDRCKVSEENLTPGRFRVTLIREPIFEGPLSAEKFLMIVKFDGLKWKVLIVERSWKCKGKIDEEWGTVQCL